jgi:hypothetical protein
MGLVSRVTMARRLNPGLDSDEEAIRYLVNQKLQEQLLVDALAELDVEEEDDADIDGALDEISAAREMLRGGPIDRAALDEALRTIAAELGGEDDQPAMAGEE